MNSLNVQRSIPLLCWLLAAVSCTGLRTGDLLFHVVDSPNHITNVTPGNIDHVAIYAGNGQVVEAIPQKGVACTTLDTLLSRASGYYRVAKVRGAHRQQSVDRALSRVGLPYDSLFLPDNEAIYCSELVVLSFVDSHGQQLFQSVPMTFTDSTGSIPLFWQQLYSRHGMDVPQGLPGSNPAELAQRRQVVLVRPAGLLPSK